MAQEVTTVEMVVARLAARSYGVVTRAQLLAAGITSDEVVHRVRIGALIRVHRGVYRVGHRAPSVEATYLAAVRACGERAVLSGRSAAYLWGLRKGRPPRPEVTAPTKRDVNGITTRRAKTIHATTCQGIPITTVPRTLVALAGDLTLDALARACHEAGVQYGTTPRQVEAVLGANAKGAKKLRIVLRGDARVTLSELERRFLELLRTQGLPLPEMNKRAGGRRVDCRWPQHRVTVELDSYRYHHSRHAWEQDRRREREAYARGDDLRRYIYQDVTENPSRMLAELRALLSGRSRQARARAGHTPGAPARANPRPVRRDPRPQAGA